MLRATAKNNKVTTGWVAEKCAMSGVFPGSVRGRLLMHTALHGFLDDRGKWRTIGDAGSYVNTYSRRQGLFLVLI